VITISKEITSWSELMDEDDSSLPGFDDFYDFSPCYLIPVTSTFGTELPEGVSIGQMLELFAQGTDSPEEKSFIFSVTSQELNYKEWLEVAEGVPGAVVYPSERKEHRSGLMYTTYLCVVPLIPRI
jgi:hypothetical protein